MILWPNARQQIRSVTGTELGEGAQVALSAPIELAFDLLVMDPDDAGSLHLEDFVLPLRPWIARKVKLSHDGQPGLAVAGEVAAVDADRASGGRSRRAFVVEGGLRSEIGLTGVNANRRDVLRT